jgi:putative transcriptional regulator
MGRIVITLGNYLKSKGVSKSKLINGANLQRTQLNNYCNNKVSRIDLDVLARICNYLECDLSDIMVYEIEK